MKKKDEKVLSKQDPELRATVMPPRQLLHHNEDVHLHVRQDREQLAGTCEQNLYINEVRIKSEPNMEPFCEDLWDVLDELGEILAEEQAVSDFEMKPVITPPPPSISLAEDTSLYTRRFKPDNDSSPINFNESMETDSEAVGKKSKKDEFIDNGNTQINKSYDSMSQNKPRSSPAKAGRKRSPSKETTAIHVNREIKSNLKSPRPTSNERTLAHKKSKTRSLTSADLHLRSKNSISDSARRRNSRSRSKRRNRSVRSRGRRRSISQNSKYCKADRKRHRSRSSDRREIRSRRRSSTRDGLERRQKSRCRSRSPDNMLRSDYIKYPLTFKRSWPERIERHRNSTSSSPKRSRNLSKMRISRYSQVRLARQRSRSRSNPGKISRRRRSRSRSIRSKFPVRNICNNRSNLVKSLTRDRSRSVSKSTKILQGQRSVSRSMSSTVPLRERSRSTSRNISRTSKVLNGTPKIIIRHSSRSPSAQSQPLLEEAMTSVPVAPSYLVSQTSQSGEHMIKPMKSASPVIISPRPIAPMITLHDNRVSQPISLRNQLLPTPQASHMFYMQSHFTNFEYRSMLSYQASGPPYNTPPVDLAPFDLRRRLDASRCLYSLEPNDLRHRIQDLHCQNTYLPAPAFNAHAHWPSGYPMDYSHSGYY